MKNKIILDLEVSDFKYNYMGLTFVFSSNTNKNKFETQVDNYIKQETLKIKNKYEYLNINFDLFLVIALYKRIEKRGFKVVTDDNISIKPNTLFLVAYKEIGKHF